MYLSIVGLLVGAVFFAFSLTPSLLPRPFLIQGVISGVSFAAGYGLGVAGVWLWKYLELPTPSKRTVRIVQVVAGLLCVLITFSFIWQAAEWQNSIRALMGIEKLAGVQPVLSGVIAAGVFVLILGLARLFQWVFRTLATRLHRHVPHRISQIISITAAVLLFWTVINGVLVNSALRVLDRSFQQLDALIDADLPHPVHAWQTGSEESLIDWKDLGRQGRSFVAGGPTAEELSDFFATPVPPPIRVYVGLNSADTPEQRARLALEELKRAGGFERSILLLVTPTGTGWVDPSSQNTVEYLHRGDIATVVAQYSYLNSPLTLLTDQGYGAENARALFTKIYDHWRTLPPESRPRLFLRGLSLGSLNSDLSFDLFDIIDDPFHGALWSGPPFRNETWRRATAERDPGSPAWLPEFRGGSVVRFMNQEHRLDHGKEEWGPFRIAFLQYASDPITFFSPESAWKEPEWMREPRGPDVSPDLRWFPIVTMLQLAADMMVGTAPKGFGHEYAPSDYIHAWLALTEPEGWSESELERLHALFD
ncbi:alpha/beta hydrolase [Ectothiorhodospira lacustris]|uniref:alpha/beta hydrolase n=1 Tax=Ectothiorhodospira lacustris TaxID=2899127 RepID=UPI001EE95397|nr:alpha/beta-hydrolase family protein [Ectothiorhodospira lacustris]MCG5501309.1 alpha/beta-hydrolase family protein [Ectothiorhodospira lacustris]